METLNAEIEMLTSQIQNFLTDRQFENDEVYFNMQNTFINELNSLVLNYETLTQSVIFELNVVQSHRSFNINGKMYPNIFKQFKKTVKDLLLAAGRIRNIINNLHNSIGFTADLSQLSIQLSQAQFTIISAAFIVEAQPPFALKTVHKFSATVRWLLDYDEEIIQNLPKVKCVILPETQIQQLFPQRPITEFYNKIPESNIELENSMCRMEYDQVTDSFIAKFTNMQIKKMNRPNREEGKTVTDDKFGLVFMTTYGNLNLCAISIPCVIIVHNNQEPQAWATIIWNIAESESINDRFAAPDALRWCYLSAALNKKFEFETGRALKQNDLDFLYEKLNNNNNNNILNGPTYDGVITWSKFCRENLNNHFFTFWDWFYANMKLVKDNFAEIWKAGHIAGFISKNDCVNVLHSNNCNFLLRFSDSKRGAISLVFLGNTVEHLDPWNAIDLKSKSLADRLRDIQGLNTVYPSIINKDIAFQEFYSQYEVPQTNDGYVRNRLAVVIETPKVEFTL